jgi:protein tyrosine/serine phosphatase
MRDILNFLFVDHAIFRPFWPNRAKIHDGVWRSSQPTYRILDMFKKLGVQHVLRLRGNNKSVNFKFEKQSCEALDLNLTIISLSARNTVSAAKIIHLLDFFDTIDVPFLMHCKSGADRTSLAAAFYLIYKCGASVEVARKQMSWRYLHFKWTKTGILDFILDQYAEFSAQNPDKTLRDWVENEYDPEIIKQAYNAIRLQNGKSPIK